MNRQKLRDAALLLPILGFVLIMPPFVALLAGGETVFGVPPLVLYIFAIWGALILVGGLLSRRLAQTESPTDQTSDPQDDPVADR